MLDTLHRPELFRLLVLVLFGLFWIGGLAALERWATRHDRKRGNRRRW